MTNYYFLAASLPPLKMGEMPEVGFDELMHRFELNLIDEDFDKSRHIRRMIDFYNVRALFLKEPLDPRGNLSEKELDDALLNQTELPEYVFEFMDRFEQGGNRIENLNFLISAYFKDQIEHAKGFLKRYFTFEWQWHVALTALRAKGMQRDIEEELKFEDRSDPFVSHIVEQKDHPGLALPKEFAQLQEVYIAAGVDPWEHYLLFSRWRFDQIDDLAEGPLFSIDWVLAYLVKYLIVESHARLNLERGEEMLREIAEG